MRVVLVDDHTLVRRGLKEMLESRGVQVVADLGPSQDILTSVYAHRPDVLVLDLAMPGEGGLALLTRWKKEYPHIPVLILSMHVEEPWVSWVLAAGAEGFLSKSSAPEDVVRALQSILEGGRPFSSEISEVLTRREQQGPTPSFTRREMEVLRRVCEGATIADLAAGFVISHNTAKSHLHSLYRKLGVSDRAQVLLKAKTLGLL